MPENKRRFKVKIANEVYTIIGKAEPDHMAAVVKIVEEQLAEIKELMPSLNNEKLAINAVSDQLYKQEELLKLKQTKPKE